MSAQSSIYSMLVASRLSRAVPPQSHRWYCPNTAPRRAYAMYARNIYLLYSRIWQHLLSRVESRPNVIAQHRAGHTRNTERHRRMRVHSGRYGWFMKEIALCKRRARVVSGQRARAIFTARRGQGRRVGVPESNGHISGHQPPGWHAPSACVHSSCPSSTPSASYSTPRPF